ncbi:MAG: beta-ketoacyl synthase N-terminal-like domain-containing protein, partial [Anaerolineae bacterium]
MRTFRLIALTPPGLIDPSLAVAASRAGELGVLNLAYIQDDVLAQRAIARMVRYGRGAHGIRLASSTAPALLDRISSHLPEQVETVILTAWSSKDLSGLISRLRERQLTVILEATSVDQAQRGEQLEVDGLIAKGSESAGWVGGETTFVLLQRFLSETSLPVWAWGGIGLHTAAACYAAGAAGVVLDSQLALTRESPLPEEAKQVIARMDGTETVCLGSELGARCRVYGRPGLRPLGVLREVIGELRGDDRPSSVVKDLWRQAVAERVGWDSPEECVWLLGQDVALARSLADRFRTVGGVFTGIREAIDDHVSTSRRVKPLDEGSPLARSHGTRYPIVQGPMTRVSDRAEFALRVAEGGGLPFVALGLMRGSEVGDLLAETHKLLGDRPWGVGILGFAPSSLRQEQLGVIQAYQPDFALIAGGRPDQARTLERQGIPTYLHVPSPGLLRMFLQDGARRFVFEGREGGGHVGPRSSFVLWDIMVDVLLEDVSEDDAEACHVLFAGGIHDGLSASMVATLAAPLLERGVRVGVLLGTAYLFTEEAIASAAIQPGFQQQAIQCAQTVLLETSPGHIIRCVETPYVHVFEQEKQRLCEEGKSAEEIHDVLEAMNVGRLRIASKGIDRHPRYGQDPDVPKFVDVSEEKQRQQGMYMVGQIAGLRNCSCTIDELHRAIAFGSSRRLEALSTDLEPVTTSTPARPSEIAIVGMSCILPRARELEAYWDNILNEVNAVVEVPKERWDLGLYFDPDRKARDKIYSRWGAFIDEVPFDPVEYGLAPNSLSSIDPMQLLALKAARMALQDAGYLARAFDRRRTSVILGASGGVGDLGASYVLRSSLPLLFGETTSAVVEDAADTLPEWTEDSFAGILLNVAAGRITNRLDLGGLNYIVDAACASSLAAVHVAVRELEFGNSDMVVTGGVDTVQNPFGYLCFSKTQALSPTGEARVFDATADGIVLGEGVAMLVLKRLADAERDGDRVYAVIQGMGGSSDGRAMGVTAPRPEGQMLALRRAYAKAGIPPSTVGLFEAHGTGTVVGDRTEALALSTFLEEAGSRPRSHAIGSVKSMIGHTKATAGVAGLAKAALALYHGVLPPTLGVTEPNLGAQNGESSLYVNSKTRPWIHGVKDYPRRAGVSAFGFGGSNFHAVLEEYAGDFLPKPAVSQHWPSELLLWSASSRAELIQAVRSVEEALAQGAQPRLRDLAYSLYEARNADREAPGFRLAVVAESLRDLQDKLGRARDALSRPEQVRIADPRGVYFVGSPHQLLAREGEVAFLFPGQGSQSPNMLLDLAVAFPEVRETFERADRVLTGRFPKPLSSYVFPPPAFSPEQEREQRQGLTQTNVAQPALGAAEMALFDLLQNLGVQPDLVAGH